MTLDIQNPQTITSGEGTGFAKVIPLDKFRPADTTDLINHKWNLYELEKERKKKLDTNLSNLPKAVVAKQEKNRNEIASDYDNLLQYSTEVAAKGIDLTSDPEFMRREQALKQKVAIDEAMAKKLDDYRSALEKDATKYDQDLFDKRLNEFNNAPTMEDRLATLNQPWLVENVDVYENLDQYAPKVQGYGALTPQQIEGAAKSYIMTNPQIVKAGIDRGIFKDEADALKMYQEEFKRRGEYKNRPQGGGGLSISVGNGTVDTGRYVMSAVHEPNVPYEFENEANQVVFADKKTGRPLPAQTLTIGGNPTFVQPLDIIKRNGKPVLRVQQAKRINAREFAKKSASEQAGYSLQADESTGEQYYVQIVGTKIQEIPFDRNSGNWRVISTVAGYDPIKVLEDANAGNSGKQTDAYALSKLQTLYKDNRAIWEKAKKENRQLTDAERKTVDENSLEVERLRKSLKGDYSKEQKTGQSSGGKEAEGDSIFGKQ